MSQPQTTAAYAVDATRTLVLERIRVDAAEELSIRNKAVSSLEVQLGITETWAPTSPQYCETLAYMYIRDFRRALDKLQHLVLQRILELEKAGMAGTGKRFLLRMLAQPNKITRLQDA